MHSIVLLELIVFTALMQDQKVEIFATFCRWNPTIRPNQWSISVLSQTKRIEFPSWKCFTGQHLRRLFQMNGIISLIHHSWKWLVLNAEWNANNGRNCKLNTVKWFFCADEGRWCFQVDWSGQVKNCIIFHVELQMNGRKSLISN